MSVELTQYMVVASFPKQPCAAHILGSNPRDSLCPMQPLAGLRCDLRLSACLPDGSPAQGNPRSLGQEEMRGCAEPDPQRLAAQRQPVPGSGLAGPLVLTPGVGRNRGKDRTSRYKRHKITSPPRDTRSAGPSCAGPVQAGGGRQTLFSNQAYVPLGSV